MIRGCGGGGKGIINLELVLKPSYKKVMPFKTESKETIEIFVCEVVEVLLGVGVHFVKLQKSILGDRFLTGNVVMIMLVFKVTEMMHVILIKRFHFYIKNILFIN